MKITTNEYARTHGDVAASLCALRVRVIAATNSFAPGEISVLGTGGMTTSARSGSHGWCPPL